MRHAPALTAVAAVTLALGIGVATTALSVAYDVVVRPLPMHEPTRLAWALEENTATPGMRPLSYPTYLDWERARAEVADRIEGIGFVRADAAVVTGAEGPEKVLVAYTTPGFFTLLGTAPAAGRAFTPGEEQDASSDVVVISHDTWQRLFGGAPEAVGQTVILNGSRVRVVGILPPDAYPVWGEMWRPIATVADVTPALQNRAARADSRTVVRFAAGTDSTGAAAALGLVHARVAQSYPADYIDWGAVSLIPLRTELLGNIDAALWAVVGAAVLVLFLACANVANLLLARAAGRLPEFAVRNALGADRRRLAQVLLVEGMLLAAVAGVFAVLVTTGLMAAVRTLAAQQLPRVDQLTLDPTTFVLGLVSALGAAVLVSAGPVLGIARTELGTRLRAGTSSLGGRGASRVRGALVSVQLALALTLLIGAGLLLDSFRRVTTLDLGFDPTPLITVRLQRSAAADASAADGLARFEQVRDAVAALPGIDGAALVNHAPLGGQVYTMVTTDASTDGRGPSALYRTASAEYLDTLGMRLVAGRWISVDDVRSHAPNIVINEHLAAQLFGTESAVGRFITVRRASEASRTLGETVTGTVVGVVGDTHQLGPTSPTLSEVFVPYTVEPWSWMTLVVKSAAPADALPRIRAAVYQVDPSLPLGSAGFAPSIRRVVDALAGTVASQRFVTSLLTGFSAVASLVALIGLYGMTSYSVTRRSREFGVRVALGATPARIVRLILGESLRLIVVGSVLGVAAAMLLARLLGAFLFEVPAVAPVTYASVTAVFVLCTLVAAAVPARRAGRADPTTAMRID